jgi:hypothetical protein
MNSVEIVRHRSRDVAVLRRAWSRNSSARTMIRTKRFSALSLPPMALSILPSKYDVNPYFYSWVGRTHQSPSRTVARARRQQPAGTRRRDSGRYMAARSAAASSCAEANAHGGCDGAEDRVLMGRGKPGRPHGGYSIHSSATRWFTSRFLCSSNL